MAEDSNTTEPDGGVEGSLSPDDIDAALGGGSAAGGEGPVQEMASDAGDAGALSQADIDAALAVGSSDTAASGGGADPDATGGDTGELPQADLKAERAGGGSSEMDAEAMTAAVGEEQAAAAAAMPVSPSTTPMNLPDFGQADADAGLSNEIDLLHDVTLRVKIELGRTRMQVEDVLRLGNGSVIELDRLAGDPVDVYANDRLVVRGEVLVLNDSFCVRVSEIISAEAAVAET